MRYIRKLTVRVIISVIARLFIQNSICVFLTVSATTDLGLSTTLISSELVVGISVFGSMAIAELPISSI